MEGTELVQQTEPEVDWSDTDTRLSVGVRNDVENPEDGDKMVEWRFDMVVGEKPDITKKTYVYVASHDVWRKTHEENFSCGDYKDVAPQAVQDSFDGIYFEE